MRKIKKIFLFLIVILIISDLSFSQEKNWLEFEALETNRKEIEKVLGEPKAYLETFGAYKNEQGKFNVWYSKGGCHKDFVGLQYDIPAQIMTQMLVYLNQWRPLKFYVENEKKFIKTPSPVMENRFYYTSPDETLTYETIVVDENEEFVYSISIEPGKNKKSLLCKDIKF